MGVYDYFDVSSGVLLKIVLIFRWTWITELACVLTVLLSRFRIRREAGICFPRSRDSSHIWVLPVYVWGLQSVFHFTDTWQASMVGLVSLPAWIVFDAIYEIALALVVLVVFQSLAVLGLGESQAVSLGLKGGRHGAAVAVLLSVFLNLSFYSVVFDFISRHYGLLLPLS